MKSLLPILLTFSATLAGADAANDAADFPVAFHSFVIDSNSPIEPKALIKQIPQPWQDLPWKLRAIDDEDGELLYQLQLTSGTPLDHSLVWDLSYTIQQLPQIKFCDPIFIPSGLDMQHRQHTSFITALGINSSNNKIPGSDGLFGSCSWPKQQRSRYQINAKHYCAPRSSDPFNWVDKKFLRFKKAWRYTGTRGEKVIIGHPDSGIHPHPEIISNVLIQQGINYVEKNSPPLDRNTRGYHGHGTATASILGSPPGKQDYFYTNQHLSTYGSSLLGAPFSEGVAPQSRILPYRVTKSIPVLFTAIKLSRAVKQAINDEVGVISISLGGPLPLPFLHRAIKKADKKGIIIVAAAGNHIPQKLFKKFVVWPARYPEIVAVAASDSDGKIWKYTSRGKQIDVTAPGVGIWVPRVRDTGRGTLYEMSRGHGTSYAAAYVAGAAALFLSHHGHDQLKKIYGLKNIGKLFKYMLKNHGYRRRPGHDSKNYGSGILDVYHLVSAPLPPASTFSAKNLHSEHPFPALDELMNVFPHTSKNAVANNLRQAFHFNSNRQLELALSRVIHELKLHLTRSPRLLNSLLATNDTDPHLRSQSLEQFRREFKSLKLSSQLQKALNMTK